MNKRTLVKKIIAQLEEDLEILYKAAQASHSEATHESSKAENKYDTRGLEAGYLAQGQMKQAGQTEQAILEFQKMPLAKFTPQTPIDLSAIVEVKSRENHQFYFIVPRSGGMEIKSHGKEIILLTPQAPLGQILMGKKTGSQFNFKLGPQSIDYHILSVV